MENWFDRGFQIELLLQSSLPQSSSILGGQLIYCSSSVPYTYTRIDHSLFKTRMIFPVL